MLGIWVPKHNPLKQGLKPKEVDPTDINDIVPKHNPLKQGLKLEHGNK